MLLGHAAIVLSSHKNTWLAERLQLMHKHAAAAAPVACWSLTMSPQKGAQGP